MKSLYKDTFSSLNDAYQACNKVARDKGFALVIRIKKPNAKKPQYMHLRYCWSSVFRITVRFFREKYLKPHFGNVSWEGEL